MTKNSYSKLAKSFGEQVELLQSRGMEISDPKAAEFYLGHLNYYRLTGYWLPFEKDHSTHIFKDNTTFNQVLNLYFFDRALRLLVLDAIERIEVSVRCRWAYEIGCRHGSHAHLDPNIARDNAHWESNLKSLKVEVERSNETFIQHLLNKYEEQLPPVWACCEVMSLGLLSRWYKNLKFRKTRQAIASTYELDQKVFESWLHHLTLIRNFCAHHSRLWNREIPQKPKFPNNPTNLRDVFNRDSSRVFNALTMILFFLNKISPGHGWRDRVIRLLDKYRIDTSLMGAPNDWRELSLWKKDQQ